MAKRVNIYKELNMPWDVVLLSVFFQPTLVLNDWSAFKKTLLNDRNGFLGILAGMFIFVILLVFFHEAQRTNAAQALKKAYPHVAWAAPTLADAIRFVVQSLWLLIIQTETAYNVSLCYLNQLYRLAEVIKCIVFLPFVGISKIVSFGRNKIELSSEIDLDQFNPKFYSIGIALLGGVCLTVPFNISAQITFILMLWLVAMISRAVMGHLPKLMLIALALAASSRYLWWRYTATLNIDSGVDVFFGVILICAETYVWLVLLLGFLQIVWTLQRKSVSLPADSRLWPSVDIFIPTCHEDLNIVRTTTLAALSMDWPEDKLNVFILDKGKRPSIQEFAAQIGVGYISQDNNLPAKTGNINHALMVTKGDYVTVFDCGYIPVRSFLQLTMGRFLEDKNLALIQADQENKNGLFYGVVQDNNNLSNASFFSGSCAVLKRAPLLEVGGVAAGLVTEDAHTALRLQRKGYTSAYINLIQAAGLTTETWSEHIGRRIRCARGMAQVFRMDNPLLGAGLNMAQRLSYANTMLYFLNGIPRLIFLLAPLGFLFFHSYLIYAPTVEIVVYALPVIVLSSVAGSYLQGKDRYSFWAGIYEAVLAWYITRPAVVALINPKIGSFSVTAKEGLNKDRFVDLIGSKPFLCLMVLNLSAAVVAVVRYLSGSADEQGMVLLYFAWAVCNLMMLGIAISVTQETKQMRLQHRIETDTEVVIKKASGHSICAVMENYSDSGLGLRVDDRLAAIEKHEKIYVLISRGDREFVFPARVIHVNQGFFDVLVENLTLQQQLDYIQCTYSRSETRLSWRQNFPQAKTLSSIKTIIMAGLHGYIVLARTLPKFITRHFLLLGASMAFIKTLLPKNINDNSIQHELA